MPHSIWAIRQKKNCPYIFTVQEILKFKRNHLDLCLCWLPLEFEELLVDFLSKLSDKGHGFDFQVVQNKTMFKNNMPGRDWFDHFLNRH